MKSMNFIVLIVRTINISAEVNFAKTIKIILKNNSANLEK